MKKAPEIVVRQKCTTRRPIGFRGRRALDRHRRPREPPKRRVVEHATTSRPVVVSSSSSSSECTRRGLTREPPSTLLYSTDCPDGMMTFAPTTAVTIGVLLLWTTCASVGVSNGHCSGSSSVLFSLPSRGVRWKDLRRVRWVRRTVSVRKARLGAFVGLDPSSEKVREHKRRRFEKTSIRAYDDHCAACRTSTNRPVITLFISRFDYPIFGHV